MPTDTDTDTDTDKDTDKDTDTPTHPTHDIYVHSRRYVAHIYVSFEVHV